MLKIGKLGFAVGVFGLAIGLGVVGNQHVYAASYKGTTLTTSPVSIDISAKPGSTATTTLLIQNNSPKPETISVSTEKFKAVGLSGQPEIYKPNGFDSSVSWVHYSQTKFVADPGVWNKIQMSVELPSSAELGYYYAVLFSPNTNSTSDNDTNKIKSSNAVLVLLNSDSPNEKRQLQVQSFTSSKSLYQYLPAKFNIIARNSGNIHLVPQGDVYISRTENGKSINSIPFNIGAGNILPNSSREFQVQWNNGFPLYQYKMKNGQVVTNSKGQPEYDLTWNFSSSLSKVRFGKYWAHLVLVYDNGSEDIPTDAYVSFWVIPWELLLFCIIIIGVVVAVLASSAVKVNKKVIKNIKKKKSNTHKQI